MTRLLHTGDTHVGYQQYHSPERRRDFLAAFEAVIEDAIVDDVDAVVHAGDLFHDRRPELPDLLGTIDILRDLRDAGIPFLAIVGNHEGTRTTQWLDLFETLGLATRLGWSGTVVEDTAVYGLDYVPRTRRDELTYDFEPRDTDHAVLVAHGRFTPFPHADWETETVLDASPVDFDAVLLGDVHDPGRATVDDTPVTYAGSTERASAEERPARGYNLVTLDEEVRIARRGIETRPFVFIDLELAAGEGTERVRRRLREESVDRAVVIVTLEGGGDAVTPAAIEAAGEEEGALLTRVNDRRERSDEDSAPAVEFADPDEAVRERVRELGLSEAARSIDERVRDDGIAKSNLRDQVAATIRDRLDDPSAFEPIDESAADPGTDDAPGADESDADNHPEEASTGSAAPAVEEAPEDTEEQPTSGQASVGDFL